MSLPLLIVVFVSIFGASAIGQDATGHRWSFQPEQDAGRDIPVSRPVIVAHRGASGMYPEHTSIAYEKAVEQASTVVIDSYRQTLNDADMPTDLLNVPQF